jgi:hypothetical protein
LGKRLALCSNDPICAEHRDGNEDYPLQGAACHACLLVPETSCESRNTQLDGGLLTKTVLGEGFPLFVQQPDARARRRRHRLVPQELNVSPLFSTARQYWKPFSPDVKPSGPQAASPRGPKIAARDARRQFGGQFLAHRNALANLLERARDRAIRLDVSHPDISWRTLLVTTHMKRKSTNFHQRGIRPKYLIFNHYMAPRGGIEPPTLRFSVTTKSSALYLSLSQSVRVGR